MKKKSSRNTKSKIVSAAWSLFYEQGYDDTTIDEIVEASGTSKGSFYHYFDGKDALLSSLSYLFDEKYEELMETMDPDMKPVDKLVYINQELFLMIENTVSVELLCRLFSSQLSAKAEKHLLAVAGLLLVKGRIAQKLLFRLHFLCLLISAFGRAGQRFGETG